MNLFLFLLVMFNVFSISYAEKKEVVGNVSLKDAVSMGLVLYHDKGVVRQKFSMRPDANGQVILNGMMNKMEEGSLHVYFQGPEGKVIADQVWWHNNGLNRNSLYGRLVGKPVELVGGGLNASVSGEMLAYDSGIALVQGSNGRQYVVDWMDSQGFRLAAREKLFAESDYSTRVNVLFKTPVIGDDLRVSYATPLLKYTMNYKVTISSDDTMDLVLSAVLINDGPWDFPEVPVELISKNSYTTPDEPKIFMSERFGVENEVIKKKNGGMLVMPLKVTAPIRVNTSSEILMYAKEKIPVEKRYILNVSKKTHSRVPERPKKLYRFRVGSDLPEAKVKVFENDEGRIYLAGDGLLEQSNRGDMVQFSVGDTLDAWVERKVLRSDREDTTKIDYWQAVVHNNSKKNIVVFLKNTSGNLVRLGGVKGGRLESATSIRVDVVAGKSTTVTYSTSYHLK